MVDYNIKDNPAFLDNYQVDMAMIPILLKMGQRGIALRQPVLEQWNKRLGEEILGYEDICSAEGFDPGKNQQVGYVLAARGNILPFTKTHKQLKTDVKTLQKINDPLVQVILGHRKAVKLKGTYIVPSLGKPRFYTNFRQDLATSRLASYDRNVQNIPPAVREIFAPDSGIWTWMDWSQIEMRIFAHLTQDPVMVDAYATGKDIHAITQQALWPGSDPLNESIRTRAKSFNFAMIYFASVYTLSDTFNLPRDVCSGYRNSWLNRYHVAHEWMIAQIASNLPYAENMFGRRMKLPDPELTSEGHVGKCRINYPVQGTAAGVVSRAMILCEKLGYDFPVQLHDELLIDGDVDPPEELAHIIPELYLPFKVQKSPVWV